MTSYAIRLAMILLLAVAVLVTSSFAQAPGHIQIKFVKAGLLVGGGTVPGMAELSPS
jgi:hypothetical protein